MKAKRRRDELSQEESLRRGSLDRFVQASRVAGDRGSITLIEALESLDTVKIEGYTKWQIAYDLKRNKFMFRTSKSPHVRSVDLNQMMTQAKPRVREESGCPTALYYPLSREDRGLVNARFKKVSPTLEKKNLRRRFKRLNLPMRLADALSAHGARCQ